MRRLIVLLPLLSLTFACLPAASSTAPSLEPPTPTRVSLQALGAYHATFEMHFEGAYSWTYRLESRSDGSAMAYDLHIEGVKASQNPGDVRIVVEGDIAKMRGPGTDDVCMQFPSDLDLGLSLLTPDDLIPLQGTEISLRSTGVEVIVGMEATHYTLRQPNLESWQDVEVDIWEDVATGAVLRHDLRAAGMDPLFDAGEGVLSGQFVVDDIGPQTIEPVSGCETDLPLPPDATRIVKMPSLVAFESTATPSEIVGFYQAALVEVGWESTAEPETGIDATLLSYHRGEQTLDINIESRETGVHVELLLSEE
ncbi:MAG: hypothetical protein AB8I69_07625 [Anaerolineae bacterium]